MEEKKTGRSAMWGVITAAAIILLVATIILSVTCVHQRNTLRQKSILTLSMAYAYMQEVYAGEDLAEHPKAAMILQSLESMSDYVDDAAMKVRDLVRLSVTNLQEENFQKIAQIVLPVQVTFDTENNTVSTDTEELDRAIAQMETLIK